MDFLNSIEKPMKALLLSPWIIVLGLYFFLTVVIPLPSEMIVKYINEIDTTSLLSGIIIYYLYFLAKNLLDPRKTKVKSIITFSIKVFAYILFIFIFFENISIVIRYSSISVIQSKNFWYNITYLSIYISFYIGYIFKKIKKEHKRN